MTKHNLSEILIKPTNARSTNNYLRCYNKKKETQNL